MSFDAGSESSVYCDGCNKTVYDGDYTYCKGCAEKGNIEGGRIAWIEERRNAIDIVREFADGEEMRKPAAFREHMDELLEWLERPLAQMSHMAAAARANRGAA